MLHELNEDSLVVWAPQSILCFIYHKEICGHFGRQCNRQNIKIVLSVLKCCQCGSQFFMWVFMYANELLLCQRTLPLDRQTALAFFRWFRLYISVCTKTEYGRFCGISWWHLKCYWLHIMYCLIHLWHCTFTLAYCFCLLNVLHRHISGKNYIV